MWNPRLYTFVVLCVSWILVAGTVMGQQRERVYGKNRVLHSNAWYVEQMRLWREFAEANPTDADAWFNLYRASRNAYIVGEETDSLNTKGANRFARLGAIVRLMERHVPASWQYHYAMWLNGNGNPARAPYLEYAATHARGTAEPQLSLAYLRERLGAYASRDSAFGAYYRSGEFSPGLLTYAYNMLVSMEPDALVFTEGDKDTDGMLILQGGRALRRDIRVLNVNLLLETAYRDRVFAELGIDPLPFDPRADDAAFARYKASVVRHVAANRGERPVYVAVSVSDEYRETIAGKLGCVGLVYRFSETPLDHTAALKRNVEQHFLLDDLREYLPYDISLGNLREFNLNYLPAFDILIRHYRASGDTVRAARLSDLTQRIRADAAFLK